MRLMPNIAQFNRSRVIWIACGGTGGHFMPGIVVGRALEKEGFSVCYFGEGKKIEQELCDMQGILMKRPSAGGSRWRRFFALWMLLRAARKDGRPHACLLFGGFASFTVGLFALTHRIPFFIFEQNAIPGRANRLLSRWSKAVFLTFPDARGHIPSSTICHVTGNPVRKNEFRTMVRDEDILILGGSQGARALNEILPAVLPPDAKIIHICGPGRKEEARQAYAKAGAKRVEILDFHPDIPSLAARSRWVFTRAGATTLAELSAVGAAAVVLPYPHAKDNHQWWNADFLAKRGAAIIMDERDLASSRGFFSALLADPGSDDAVRQKIMKAEIADVDGKKALTIFLEILSRER